MAERGERRQSWAIYIIKSKHSTTDNNSKNSNSPTGYRYSLTPAACTLPSPHHPSPGDLVPPFLFSCFLFKKKKGKKTSKIDQTLHTLSHSRLAHLLDGAVPSYAPGPSCTLAHTNIGMPPCNRHACSCVVCWSLSAVVRLFRISWRTGCPPTPNVGRLTPPNPHNPH